MAKWQSQDLLSYQIYLLEHCNYYFAFFKAETKVLNY